MYGALAYEECKSGSLTNDSLDVIEMVLNNASADLKHRAETKIKAQQEEFGHTLLLALLEKAVGPTIGQLNANSRKLIRVLR